MKALASTLQWIGALPGARTEKGPRFVELKPRSVRLHAVERLATRLGVPPALVLRLIGIPERTALLRRTSGFLAPMRQTACFGLPALWRKPRAFLARRKRLAGG